MDENNNNNGQSSSSQDTTTPQAPSGSKKVKISGKTAARVAGFAAAGPIGSGIVEAGIRLKNRGGKNTDSLPTTPEDTTPPEETVSESDQDGRDTASSIENFLRGQQPPKSSQPSQGGTDTRSIGRSASITFNKQGTEFNVQEGAGRSGASRAASQLVADRPPPADTPPQTFDTTADAADSFLKSLRPTPPPESPPPPPPPASEGSGDGAPEVPPAKSGSKVKISGKTAARIAGFAAAGPIGSGIVEAGIRAKARSDNKKEEQAAVAEAENIVRGISATPTANDTQSSQTTNSTDTKASSPKTGSKIKISGKTAARIGSFAAAGPLGSLAAEAVIRKNARRTLEKEQKAAVAEAENIVKGNQNPTSNPPASEKDIATSTGTPAPQNTPSSTPPTTSKVLRPAAAKATKGTKNVLKYTPEGFLIGKIAPRLKERLFARKASQEVGNQAQATQKEKKRTGISAKKATNIAKKLSLFSLFPTFFLVNPFIPKKLRNAIKKRLEATTQKAQQKKETVKQAVKKTTKGYQKNFIDQTLERARKKGYNRFWLIQKIRDWKVWKNRPWQEQANQPKSFTPGRNPFQPAKSTPPTYKREERRDSSSTPSPRQISRLLEGEESSFANWTSPRGIGQQAWNRFGSPRISSMNRSLGRKLRQRAAKKVASSAARSAANQVGKKVVQQALTSGARALVANPVGLTVIGCVLAFVLVIVIVILAIGGGGDSAIGIGGGGGGSTPPPNENPIPNFSLTKSVSITTLPAPKEITYTLTYAFLASTVAVTAALDPDSVVIFDTVPDNTTLVANKTTGKYLLSSDGKTISWALSEPENKALSSFTFTVMPTSTDITVTNSAWAEANALVVISPTPGGNTPPNTDTCNGTYPAPPQGNFGDPSCNFTKDDLYRALKSQDPANADYWYLKIVPCESGYNPNAYLAASTSGLGAYGLFQMNPSGRGNGEYDAGNVNWPLQISNAINYNKLINGSFAYWACR